MTTTRRPSPRPRAVLTAIARTAARLCEAGDALIFQAEGDRLRLVAKHGSLRAMWRLGEIIPINRGTVLGLTLCKQLAELMGGEIGVTSQPGQGANDSISWVQLGGDQTILPASFTANSAGGSSDTVTLAGANSMVSVVCSPIPANCSWTGGSGFTAGDSLIWTSDSGNGGNGPVTLTFSVPIVGAGALIQANMPGQFTAEIEAFNGTTSLGLFTVTSDINGDGPTNRRAVEDVTFEEKWGQRWETKP